MPETKEIVSIDGRPGGSSSPGGEDSTNGSQEPKATQAVRRRLPDERRSLTHHFSVGGQEGYVTVGLYEDQLPGDVFIRMAKEGSTVSGLMDSFATAVSLALQYGVPLQILCDKFSHTRFEPSGWSGNPKIGYASSVLPHPGGPSMRSGFCMRAARYTTESVTGSMMYRAARSLIASSPADENTSVVLLV
jgi:hypothetical protein